MSYYTVLTLKFSSGKASERESGAVWRTRTRLVKRSVVEVLCSIQCLETAIQKVKQQGIEARKLASEEKNGMKAEGLKKNFSFLSIPEQY